VGRPETRSGALLIIAALAVCAPASLWAQPRNTYTFRSEQNCVAARKFSAEQCANAVANSRAEFEEKAPRFPTREACERLFKEVGCSLGFKGADGWAGKKSGLYFSPRQLGFTMTPSGRDGVTAPFTSGPPVAFSTRTIARRDAGVNFAVGQKARDSWRAEPGSSPARATSQDLGVPNAPAGDRGALPSPPPVDPNFDCASFLEPAKDGQAGVGCYPAPARK
jgi:uncharacterized protein YgiB involved in biofilm formation